MEADLPMPTLDLTNDFDKIRALFPVTQTQAYLMNPAQSPLNTPFAGSCGALWPDT